MMNESYVHAPADDHHIAFPAVKHRNTGQQPPAHEAETLEQRQARVVMPIDEADQIVDLQSRRAGNGLREQKCAYAVAALTFPNIDAHFSSAVVRRAAVEI